MQKGMLWDNRLHVRVKDAGKAKSGSPSPKSLTACVFAIIANNLSPPTLPSHPSSTTWSVSASMDSCWSNLLRNRKPTRLSYYSSRYHSWEAEIDNQTASRDEEARWAGHVREDQTYLCFFSLSRWMDQHRHAQLCGHNLSWHYQVVASWILPAWCDPRHRGRDSTCSGQNCEGCSHQLGYWF